MTFFDTLCNWVDRSRNIINVTDRTIRRYSKTVLVVKSICFNFITKFSPIFCIRDEDVFKDLLTSVVNLQLGTAGEDPEKKFSSDEELSEKLGEVLFALCRFCAKYKVSGEMALLKKLEEF